MTDHITSNKFYHGTKADLEIGDTIHVGHPSNHHTRTPMSWVYFTRTIEAATWGAELASGDGRQRIFIVEPTGPFFDDPNLTNKKFPGNPTMSYRSKEPLRIVGELSEWQPHTPEQLQEMTDSLARLRAAGKDIVID